MMTGNCFVCGKSDDEITTEVSIDHREWKEWRDAGEYGAIGKLNELLSSHGVKIELAGPHPAEDWVELRAISQAT